MVNFGIIAKCQKELTEKYEATALQLNVKKIYYAFCQPDLFLQKEKPQNIILFNDDCLRSVASTIKDANIIFYSCRMCKRNNIE